MCQDHRILPLAFLAAITALPFLNVAGVSNVIALLFMAYLINLGGFYGVISMLVTALLMMVNYNAENKRLIKKWYVFYAYYPLHLMVLVILRMYM